MATINPPDLIEPPVAPQRPYGLFDVALGPMPFPNPNAQGGGVIYVPDDCEDDVFVVAMSCPPITGTKTFSPVEAAISGTPFAVLTSYTCGSIGFDFNEAERRVRTRMRIREQRAVERRVWPGTSGVLGTVPGLFRGAVNLGAVNCPAEAISLLEQTLADNAVNQGIIHARSGLASLLYSDFLIERLSPTRLATVLGHSYAFGQGYDGTGPTGQPVTATTEWMYATGRVLIWQDPEVFVPPPERVMDKTLNQINLVAERVYAVAIECGIWAVQVTHSCATAGEG